MKRFTLAHDFYNNIDDLKIQELFLSALMEWQKLPKFEALRYNYRTDRLKTVLRLAQERKQYNNIFKNKTV